MQYDCITYWRMCIVCLQNDVMGMAACYMYAQPIDADDVSAEQDAQQSTKIFSETKTHIECLYEMVNNARTTEYKEAVALFENISWLIGVSPMHMNNIFTVIRWIMVITGEIILFLLVTVEMFHGCGESLPSFNIMLFCCSFISIVKCASYRIYARNMICVFNSLEKDYVSINDDSQLTIMKTHVSSSKRICSSFVFLAAFSCISIDLYPFFTYLVFGKLNVTDYNLPIDLPVPLYCTYVPDSVKDYAWMYVVQVATITISCTGNVGSDCLFIILGFHICAQIKILQIEFSDLGNDGKPVYKKCSHLITKHNSLLLLTEQLIEMVSALLAVQLAIGCVLICIMGFQLILVLKGNDYAMLVQTLFILSFFPTQLFAYSYVGDFLKCRMEEVGYAAYSCCWYNLSSDIHRDLSFVITRSYKLVQIAAGGYFPINFQTYTTILKTSLSYLSVLRVILDE